MNELQVFSKENWSVRSSQKDGKIWFVAQDVCKILAIKNSRDAVSKLDDDEKGVVLTDTLGGGQKLQAVNEFGLYSLILASRKQEAKDFKRWVTHEVLPSIRKTGGYSISKEISDYDFLTLFWNDIIRKHRQIEKLKTENDELKIEKSKLMRQIHATFYDYDDD